MAAEFDLDEFLKNYKPKSLKKILEPYLQCKKLKSYQLLEHHNKYELVPFSTYIKYIKIDNAFKDKHYSDHVRGGLLLSGGRYIKGEYTKTDDPSIWTHLMLKFDPTPIDDDNMVVNRSAALSVKQQAALTFMIQISRCYVFYKKFVNYHDDNDKRERFTKILNKLSQ